MHLKQVPDFPGYEDKLERLQKTTGLKEAVVTGVGKIYGQRCVLGIMDSNFFMGSMGSIVGENKTLGVYLPLITTNCAVLGVTIMNIDESYSFGQSLVNAVFSGVGFALAMVIFSGVRSRVDDAESETPKMFRGVPATLIAAAIVSMSFLGFGGLGQ